MDKKDSLDRMYKTSIEYPDTKTFVWYTRCNTPWKQASEEQIKSVTAYLDTHDENQPIGEFKDIRFNGATIYTVYCSGDALVELLYDDPKHVAYIDSLR